MSLSRIIAIVLPLPNQISHARLTASIDNALEPPRNKEAVNRSNSIGMQIARVLWTLVCVKKTAQNQLNGTMKINRLKTEDLLINAVLFLVLVLPVSALSSDPIQPHKSILDAARNHAKNNATGYSVPPVVTANRLDSRLRLSKCSQPLETFSPPAGRKLGRVTVGVRCSGSKPWSLYVPVMVSLVTDVIVAADNLARGTVLSSSDLMLKKKDIARLRGHFFKQPAEAVGMVLKRSLQQGQVLHSQHTVTQKTVKKGSKVIILARSSKIEVRMPGKALSSGATGERIKVRNIHSKKEVEATVISPGVVRVAL